MKQQLLLEPNARTIVASQFPTQMCKRLKHLLVLLFLTIALRLEAADFSASGGFQPGLFTWLDQMQISGSGFTPTLHYIFSIYGPLDLPGVTPADRVLQAIDADGAGNLNGTLNIPYVDLATLNASLTKIPRPGRYELRTIGPGGQIVKQLINLCPQTIPRSVFSQYINWGVSRGGRDGWLDDKSPERTDPEWLSIWDERPVSMYATVAETDSNGDNQPDIIAHHEFPGSHYAHDANLLLVPDPEYQWVLGTANFEGTPGGHSTGRIELEWELQNSGRSAHGSYGTGNIGLPLWAMATSGDRVFTVGRWVMDHGHLEHGDRTEIHPPRLLATIRKHHTVVPFEPDECVTRASQVDIYASGHGGGANLFYDSLSAVLNDNGRGGGRIEDVMDKDADAPEGLPHNNFYTYYAYGPSDSGIVDALKLYKQIVADVETSIAGPSGFAFNGAGQPVRSDDPSAVSGPWNLGPEERLINDMNYDFDVPLPAPPEGATAIQVQVDTHPEHTTAVNEVITYTNPDPVTGLPTKAHIHLPYNGADNGIFARTLKFYWDAYNPPGRHFVVTLDDLTFFLPQSFSGKAFLWLDVNGQRINLTDLDPERILDAKATLGTSNLGAARFDVYLDPDQKLRVFAYGYDAQALDDLYGADVGIPAYDCALHILWAYLDGQVALNPNDGDSEKLGGALFESSPTPIFSAAGVKRNKNSQPFFYNLAFTIKYVHDPRLKVTGLGDFGKVCIASGGADRVVRISNAATGLVANSGIDTLNVDLALSDPALSLVPASTPTSFVLNAGEFVDVTVRFTPTAVNQQPGSLMLTSNDVCHPSLVFPFCADSVPTGFRLLVAQPDGTPYSLVDQITLHGEGAPNPTTQLRNVPLSVKTFPAGCSETEKFFHYLTELPASEITGNPGRSYEVRARVGTKSKTVTFTLDNCEFEDIVITP